MDRHKRIKNKKFFNYKKTLRDRSDGWRIKPKDPTFLVIPHVMPMRCDAQVFFSEEIETTQLDKFVNKIRHDDSYKMPKLSKLAVIMAALIRTFASYPKINRFVGGKHIYARNHFCISLIVKKSMKLNSNETNVKMYYDPDATLKEVYDKLEKNVSSSKNNVDNDMDKFVSFLNKVPQWIIKAFMHWVRYRDRHRGLPKSIYDFSPFHTSVYITDIGSTGINSIFHHIYNLGTTSLFVSIGRPGKKLILEKEKVKYIKTIKLNCVIDERICDGFYYAKAVRYFISLLKRPEKLIERPENIEEDKLD